MSLEASQGLWLCYGTFKAVPVSPTATVPKEQNMVVVSMSPTSPPADVKILCQCLSHSTVTVLAKALQPLPSSCIGGFIKQSEVTSGSAAAGAL